MADGLEGIDVVAVTAWLADRLENLETPLDFELLAGGHSNLTYRVTDGAANTYVLRRPPLGHVLQSAHDMGREHKIIFALQGSSVPVATTVGLCADDSVNDAPFYVMNYVAGPVLHSHEAAAALSEKDRGALGLHVIDVLAALHQIDPDAVGLGDLGRKEAYLQRQMKRWVTQWDATKTHEVPAMDESTRLLAERMPEQVGSAIVHGDYRLGNMITNDGKVSAVLDWELCTLGDPLADVGYLLNSWVAPGEREEDLTPTSAGGFCSRETLSARYAQSTGRDLSDINYYRAFSHWRLAAINQGVYKRYLVGAMGEGHDVDLDAQKQGVTTLSEMALELLS
ncbi:MAG: phosphotransferase family protein [OM182 bacterium]|nr:MAG: phosphotransferase family protein [OM182 bacterium]